MKYTYVSTSLFRAVSAEVRVADPKSLTQNSSSCLNIRHRQMETPDPDLIPANKKLLLRISTNHAQLRVHQRHRRRPKTQIQNRCRRHQTQEKEEANPETLRRSQHRRRTAHLHTRLEPTAGKQGPSRDRNR